MAYAHWRTIGDQAGLIYTCIGLARRTGLRPMEGIALYNLCELNRDAGRYAGAVEY